MSSTLKILIFWLMIVAAAGGVYHFSMVQQAASAPATVSDVAGEWRLDGKPDQQCAIFRQGSVLLVVNERGDIASARAEGETRIVVVRGDGWTAGLMADVRDGGKTLVWQDGSTWTRR